MKINQTGLTNLQVKRTEHFNYSVHVGTTVAVVMFSMSHIYLTFQYSVSTSTTVCGKLQYHLQI